MKNLIAISALYAASCVQPVAAQGACPLQDSSCAGTSGKYSNYGALRYSVGVGSGPIRGVVLTRQTFGHGTHRFYAPGRTRAIRVRSSCADQRDDGASTVSGGWSGEGMDSLCYAEGTGDDDIHDTNNAWLIRPATKYAYDIRIEEASAEIVAYE